MARIVFGSYMVRYPLGGMMSHMLQYLLGFRRLGHEVWFVEKATRPRACFDPSRGIMTDDSSAGTEAVDRLLDRFGIGDRWAFVDVEGQYHGMDECETRSAFETADLFVDMGTHGSWLEEAADAGQRVLIDGEPGFNQMKMELEPSRKRALQRYDRHFTNGLNVGTPTSSAPTAGVRWEHIIHPVVVDLFEPEPPPPDAPWTTVMNWQSHDPLTYRGRTYGQKDVEFERFAGLPRHVGSPMELAIAGDAPREELRREGWRLSDAQQVSSSVEDYWSYLKASRGEFTIWRHRNLTRECRSRPVGNRRPARRLSEPEGRLGERVGPADS